MVDLIGQTLGQYRIIEQIGQGGMATVYKAYQPALDRYVAVKVLPPYFAHEPGFAMRFTREAKAIAKLNHPNILPIYDFGQEGDLSYIVMKFVEAGTLKDIMDDEPLPLDVTADVLRQIAGALDHAHQRGILHRDVKPSNVLLDEGRWVLLTDFGLAKMVEGSAVLTASGVGVGTPAYMSPEQGRGEQVDARADIYSLGVVLYEMLTGRVPFQAETPMAVVIKHITDPLPLPRSINPELPEVVERVVLKALAKEPGDRFASTTKMADALATAVVAAAEPAPPTVEIPPVEPVPAPPPTPPPQPAGLEPVPAMPSEAPAAVPTPTPPAIEAPVPTRKPFPWKIVGAVAGIVLLALVAVFGVSNLGGGEAVDTPTAVAVVTDKAATSTPEREPTATQKPSRLGEELRKVRFEEVYLKADFERPGELRIDLPGGWEVGDDGSGNRVLTGKPGAAMLLFPAGFRWTDYILEARVMLVEGREGYVFARWPADSAEEGMALAFAGDRWELVQEPGWREIDSYHGANNMGVWHHLRVVAVENRLAAFLDDDLMFDAEIESLHGTVGFGVHEDSVIFVDDLRITGPPLAPERAVRELYDDFDQGVLDEGRWEWLPAMEGHTAEVDDGGRLLIRAENPGPDPQHGDLKALTGGPIVEVLADLTVEHLEGENTDLGINLSAEGPRFAGVVGGEGAVVAFEEGAGTRIFLEGKGLPAQYHLHLILTPEEVMHIVVDGREVGAIPAPPVADGFSIAYQVDPGGALVAQLDNVQVRFAEAPAGIRLWHFYQPDSVHEFALARLVERAREVYPDLAINLEHVPFGEIFDRYREEVVAGGGPDLLLRANDHLGDMVREGLVLDLDPYLAGKLDGVSEMGTEGMKVDGKLYGVPESAKAVALYYNRSLIDTPPATTDELLEAVRDGTPMTFVTGAYFLFGWTGAFGGQLMDADGRCIADQGGWTEALEYLLALQEAGAAFEPDRGAAQAPFRDGETAFFVDGPWALDECADALGENLGLAPMPAGPGGPATPFNRIDGFYVNPNSDNVGLAVDLALFLTSRESAQFWTDEAGHTPIRSDVTPTDPLVAVFTEVAATGFQQPHNAELNHYWEPFDEMFRQVLEGAVSPAEGVSNACAAMNAASESSMPGEPEHYRCQDELGCVEIPPGEPIHIAYLLDRSGVTQSVGEDSLRGIELAIDERRDILGHPIELTGEDSGCSPEAGEAAASRITEDPSVLAIIGPTCSTAAATAAPVISQAGLAMVSPSNTKILLTDPRVHEPGYLRVAPNERMQARVAAQFAWEVLGVTRAATLHDSTVNSRALQQVFAATFKELGGQITNQAEVRPDDADDMRAVLALVGQTEPELLFYPLFGRAGGLVTRQARETDGLEEIILMIGSDTMFGPELLEVAGPAADGLFLSTSDLTPVSEGYPGFLERYTDRYSAPPQTDFHAYAYDATMMILAAIEQAAVQDQEALHIGRQALRGALFGTRSFEGLTGVLNCTPHGDCADARVSMHQVVSAEPGSWNPGSNPIQVWP